MRRFYLLAVIVGFAGISGCYWDSELYDTFVADDGNVEHCPGMASIRYYTDKKYDTNSNNQKNYITCTENNGIIACEKDDVKVRYDSGSWKPVNNDSNTTSSDKPDDKQTELIKDLAGKHASMALAFKHKICPKNYFCKNDDEFFCSNKEIIVQEVVCGEGLQTCGDNICHNIETDPNHCGTSCEDCHQLGLPDNASTHTCESGECVPVCDEEYHVEENEKNGKTCVEDDQFNCKGKNCKDTIPGWATGRCETGVCKIEKCQDNMYLSDNKCEVVSNANCGGVGKSCNVNENCVYNNGNYECQHILCEDLDSSLRDCGDRGCLPESPVTCGKTCINCYDVQFEHASKRSCKNEQCEFECDAGYHKNKKGDSCETDSPEACGSWNTPCQEDNRECKNGSCECIRDHADCDDNGSCETQLSTNHLQSCNVCISDFEDCDGNGSCETQLSVYGLKRCNECLDGYTKCGTINIEKNVKIPLCLKLAPPQNNGFEQVSENACEILCNYDNWQANNTINTEEKCPADRYVCCGEDDTPKWHTKVNKCYTNEGLCESSNYSVDNKYKETAKKSKQLLRTYFDKNQLDKYLETGKVSTQPKYGDEKKDTFKAYWVKTCQPMTVCHIVTSSPDTINANTKPKDSFSPLIVECSSSTSAP